MLKITVLISKIDVMYFLQIEEIFHLQVKMLIKMLASLKAWYISSEIKERTGVTIVCVNALDAFLRCPVKSKDFKLLHTPLLINVSYKTADQSEDGVGGASVVSFCLQMAWQLFYLMVTWWRKCFLKNILKCYILCF